jgi:hypothetical protein
MFEIDLFTTFILDHQHSVDTRILMLRALAQIAVVRPESEDILLELIRLTPVVELPSRLQCELGRSVALVSRFTDRPVSDLEMADMQERVYVCFDEVVAGLDA